MRYVTQLFLDKNIYPGRTRANLYAQHGYKYINTRGRAYSFCIVPICCKIAPRIRDVYSHGSPSTRRVTHDGNYQISGNQRVSVWRAATRRAKHGSSPLSLRSQPRDRKRHGFAPRRPAIGDGWVSPLTVLSIHALAPFPQLNNCIHIHPPVLSPSG